MPLNCDGCGAPLTFCHALNCKKGDLVTHWHNAVQNALDDLVSMGYNDVLKELLVREADNSQGIPDLNV